MVEVIRVIIVLEAPVAGGCQDIIKQTPSIDPETGTPIVMVELSRSAASNRKATGKNIGNPQGCNAC